MTVKLGVGGERHLDSLRTAEHFESAFWWAVVWLGTVTPLDTRIDISLLRSI